MPQCSKCPNTFPSTVVIDGKRRNLCNRKFCFECSPFNSHNTKNLIQMKTPRSSGWGVCLKCDRDIPPTAHSRITCYICTQKKRELSVRSKVYGIVGTKCWLCPYDKGMNGTPVLDFHHLNPEEKCFGLDIRRMTNLSWKRVFAEMQKCVLLCCRCHREVEHGLIPEDVVAQAHIANWDAIRVKP